MTEIGGAQQMTSAYQAKPRILVLAYACDPYAGSEAGAGWTVVKRAANVGSVTALMADVHSESVNKWLRDHPETTNIEVVPVPAKQSRGLKRLISLDRRFGFVPYIDWLPRAGAVAREMHSVAPFDLSVHGGYGAYWLPSPLVDLDGVPCVWGPVGGGTRTPSGLRRYLGVRGWFGELQKSVLLSVVSKMPSVRKTWARSSVHLFETYETLKAMPALSRSRAEVLNRVLLADQPQLPTNPGPVVRDSTILFPSLVEPRKGPSLVLEAMVHTPEHARLLFVNDGYAVASLKRKARRLGLDHRVEFLGRLPRDEMLAMIRTSSCVAFAGLREEGGMALVEAMTLGSPVVVLSHGGPRIIVDHALDPERIKAIEPGSAVATTTRFGQAMAQFVEHPVGSVEPNIDEVTVQRFTEILSSVAASHHRR